MPITKNVSSYFIDLSDVVNDLTLEDRKQLKEEVGKYVVTEIKKDLRRTTSPVTGNKFDALSPGYAEQKKKQGKPPIPNLRLKGTLISDLKYKDVTNGVEVFVDGQQKELLKSYNHNVGDTVPARPFLPEDSFGETFKKEIETGINSIKSKYEANIPQRTTVINQEEESIILDALIRELFG